MIREVKEDVRTLESDGLGLHGISKLQLEMFERKFDSPLAVYSHPFSRGAWRQLAAELRRRERKSGVPAMQERYSAARKLASKMPEGASPWDLLTSMWEIEQNTKLWIVDGVARRIAREAAYKILMRYVGRN